MAKAAKTAATPAVDKSAAKSTELAVIDAKNYALISNPGALAAIQYNLRDEKLSEFDLDRVKVPAAGGTVFQVPTIDGIKNEEVLEGIMLGVQVRRAFWESQNVDGSPPDCYSINGTDGVGNPGGSCAGCPHNEFGSAVKPNGEQGKGKACRERRIVMFLRADDRLPLIVVAPPTSIKGTKKFLMHLPVPMFQAVVRIRLEKVSAKPDYSIINFEYVGQISHAQGLAMAKYADTIRNAIIGQAPLHSETRNEDEELPPDPNTIDAVQNPEIPDDEEAGGE